MSYLSLWLLLIFLFLLCLCFLLIRVTPLVKQNAFHVSTSPNNVLENRSDSQVKDLPFVCLILDGGKQLVDWNYQKDLPISVIIFLFVATANSFFHKYLRLLLKNTCKSLAQIII